MHTRFKLRADEANVVAAIKSGETYIAIARRYGVSPVSVLSFAKTRGISNGRKRGDRSPGRKSASIRPASFADQMRAALASADAELATLRDNYTRAKLNRDKLAAAIAAYEVL